MEEVCDWLRKNRLNVFVPAFQESEINGEMLLDVQQEDLDQMSDGKGGVGVGTQLQRRQLFRVRKRAIEGAASAQAAGGAAAPKDIPAPPNAAAGS